MKMYGSRKICALYVGYILSINSDSKMCFVCMMKHVCYVGQCVTHVMNHSKEDYIPIAEGQFWSKTILECL